MKTDVSNSIVKILMRAYPDPEPDLIYSDHYQLIISVVLSARTTDIQVNRVTPELFRKYPSFRDLAGADHRLIEKIIKSTGFYKTKSKNIIALSRMILEKFNGDIPREREKLMELPGVGRKTANVVLSVAFKIPAFAVDTHVTRIAVRLNYTDSTDPLIVENSITSIVNENHWADLHLAMILHGRKICKAARPLCNDCILSSLCPSCGLYA